MIIEVFERGRLDEDVARLLISNDKQSLSAQPLEEIRRNVNNTLIDDWGGGDHLYSSGLQVKNTAISVENGCIPIRIYRYSEIQGVPIVVFFHGGGWVVGDLDTHDQLCRILADKANCIVVSIGYRLSPENKFPIPLMDAFAGYLWVQKNTNSLGGDAQRISVCGDSAGGNLAACVCAVAQDKGATPPASQILIYPVIDVRINRYKLSEQFSEGYGLSQEDMHWFVKQYLTDQADADNGWVTPFIRDDIALRPPALVITA